jgi:NADH dehydrogenase
MVEAAERAGAERFVFFSALNASAHNRTRFLRAKALAEDAVTSSSLDHVVFAPSIVYAPGDPFMTLLGRMALLPVMPVSGRGLAHYQPIWAEDVAECVVALLDGDGNGRRRFELAGPETLTHTEIVRTMVTAAGRPRPVVHVPTAVVSRTLRATEAIMKSKAPATWDEAELMEVSMVTPSGTADAEALGVAPRRMAAVLGA